MSTDRPPSDTPPSDPGQTLRFHEGSITLPTDYDDRTTNVFVPTERTSEPNLSITRDRLPPDESLAAYVERQCALLKKQLPGRKQLASDTEVLGQGTTPLTGIRIDSQYKNGPHTVWQRQAAFLVADRRVLIFTASHTQAPDTAFNTRWTTWLSSFRPHPTPT